MAKRSQPTTDLMSILIETSAIVRKHGWTSKGAARRGEARATIDVLMAARETGEVKTTRTDTGNVKRALAWVAGLADSGSDYERKLHDLLFDEDGARREEINESAAGFAASAVGVYLGREAEVKANADKAAGSDYIGTVGERLTIEATLSDVRYSPRWDCYLNEWTTADGNVVTWFTRNDQGEPGDLHKITGKVKRHSEFKGVRVTGLNRCKVERV